MHSIVHVGWGIFKHIATGYLIYSIVEHSRGRSPTGKATIVLLFGTLFPDLVDKSLVYIGILDYGREFAHSLFTTIPIISFVIFIAHRVNQPQIGIAFGLGYISHLPVDMYGTLLTGDQSMDTAFLFWPIVTEYPLGIMTPTLPVSRSAVFTIIGISAACLWVYDGYPIVSDLRSR